MRVATLLNHEVIYYYFFSYVLFSSSELSQLGHLLMGTKFRGVFPLDRVPQNLRHDGGFIVNSHSSTLPGEHWIAVYVHPTVVKVFDPLGFYYPSSLVSQIERQSSGRVEYNRLHYQHPLTTLCGHYCLLWLTLQTLL